MLGCRHRRAHRFSLCLNRFGVCRTVRLSHNLFTNALTGPTSGNCRFMYVQFIVEQVSITCGGLLITIVLHRIVFLLLVQRVRCRLKPIEWPRASVAIPVHFPHKAGAVGEWHSRHDSGKYIVDVASSVRQRSSNSLSCLNRLDSNTFALLSFVLSSLCNAPQVFRRVADVHQRLFPALTLSCDVRLPSLIGGGVWCALLLAQ